MKNLTVLFCIFLLFASSLCLSQTKTGKLDANAKKLIGQWKWNQIVTLKKDNQKIIQSEYMPGTRITHFMKINKDLTLDQIEKVPGKKDIVTKGTWEVKGDTLISYADKRAFTQTYKFEKNKLYLTWIRIEGSNFKDYSKNPYKTIDEYIKK